MSNLAVPTLSDLVNESDELYKDNAFMVLLNQDPPDKWLDSHPIIKVKNAKGESVPLKYLPITRVEYILSRIFTKWWVEVKDVKLVANSVVVTVRVFVKNPTNGEIEWNDGIGASPIQIKANSGGAIDFQNMQSAAIQMSAPAAESYAVKDAAEKWGKIFGKDLNRKDVIDYSSLLKEENCTFDELNELYETLDKYETERGIDLLTDDERAQALRVIKNKEERTYNVIRKLLTTKLGI